MKNVELKQKAESFRAMHHGPGILVLPNAWDVASARVLEEAGMCAIATTSAGIAFSLGYPDGQHISRDEMIAAVARIAKAVKVPVTADVEAGYGNRAQDAARTAKAVIEAGAVGINLEDSTGNPERPLIDLPLAVERIKAVRESGRAVGVALAINARTDVYLENVGAAQTRFDEVCRRGRAFRDAGADCVFVPGVTDDDTIESLVKELKCPINILAGPGAPSTRELEDFGVARVSMGSKPMLAGLGLLRRLVRELAEKGTYSALEGLVTHSEMQKILGA